MSSVLAKAFLIFIGEDVKISELYGLNNNSHCNSSLTGVNDGLEEAFEAISKTLRLSRLHVGDTEGLLTHR